MRYPGFIGPTYQSRSLNADAERTINLYPEVVESGQGVNDVVLYTTPGMTPFVVLADYPVRGMFSENDRLFVVSGTSFYEVDSGGVATRYGTVDSDGDPATISSNGHGGNQLFITTGGTGYIFDLEANSLIEISDLEFLGNEVGPPAGTATRGAYVDGFFVVLDTANNKFQLSSLNDGLEWNGLDVAQRSFGSDPIKAMQVDHREIWFLGEKTSEVWYNTGDESFPFQPIVGTFIEQGIVAPWSLSQLDNSIFWLGGSSRGTTVAYRAKGYTPMRISTHAVEIAWSRFSTVTDAISYVYQQAGHYYYILYFPQGDTHWVYDVTTGMWHERALWDLDLMRWIPHLSRAAAFAFEKNLLGDRQSGAIYDLRLDLFDENVVYPGPTT